MESYFKVELQYSDELEPPSDELLRAQKRLEELVADVKHPYGLTQFLVPIKPVPIRADRIVSGSISWHVWKGSTGRARRRSFSASRFVIQRTQFSDDLVILLVRYRGPHEIYEFVYLPQLQAGKIAEKIPTKTLKSEPKPIFRPPVTRIKAPVITDLSFKHTITESIKIPASLNRNEVKECIDNRLDRTIAVENQLVRITTHGDSTHLQLVGKSDQQYRAYDSACLEKEERWNAVRHISEAPDLDPCLILSTEESDFLKRFTQKEFLPARIDGSAGSGKTTLLTITLANLIANRREEDLSDLWDSPLFITYSTGLRDAARMRLWLYLIIHHGWSKPDAVNMAERVCKTFSNLIDEVLADEEPIPQSTDKKKPNEWDHFKEWWNKGSDDSTYKRAGMNPADAYRAMRTCIFGYLPADVTANHEQLAEVFERLEKRNASDITKSDLTKIIDLWDRYRTDHPNFETNADRTLRAIDKITSNPDQFATWGHILCDEVQDLSDHDLRLLACLTHHLAIGKTNLTSSSENKSFRVVLPLILAGDEMQSVNPSGFTFVGCEEVYREFASDLGYQLDSMPKPLLLTENFRSLSSIVELGTACRQLHNSFDRDRVAPKVTVHRKGENVGQIARVEYNGLPNESIRNLFNTDIAILVPCRTEEKANYCQPNGELSRLLGIDEFNIESVKTPEECKGIEYTTVVICGFAKAYEDALKANHRSWTLNALSVATTRARDKIYFLDNKNYRNALWNDLATRGKLATLPISKEIIEVSLDEQADFLNKQLMTALCDDYGTATQLGDSKQQIEALKTKTDNLLANPELPPDHLHLLELNSHVAQSWLNYVNGDAIEDWQTLATYYNGKVWRRLIDDAIANKRKNVLVDAMQFTSNIGSENANRMFLATCVCFFEESKDENEPSALYAMYKRLDAFNTTGDIMTHYFSNLNPGSTEWQQWKLVQSRAIGSNAEWDRDKTDEIVDYLKYVGLSIPLKAAIEVRSNIKNMDVALTKLNSNRDVLRIAGSLFRTLQTEILLYHYGVSWLDRATIEKEIAPILESGFLDKSLLFESLTHDLPRSDTEKQLQTVMAIANAEVDPIDGRSQNAKDLARASIRSLVQHEAVQLLNSLENASTAIQSKHDTERTENGN